MIIVRGWLVIGLHILQVWDIFLSRSHESLNSTGGRVLREEVDFGLLISLKWIIIGSMPGG